MGRRGMHIGYWWEGQKERKRPLGRRRRRWVDNIKSGSEVVWGGMVWIDVAEDMNQWRAVVKAVLNLRVP
jgi:hypothetical protein